MIKEKWTEKGDSLKIVLTIDKTATDIEVERKVEINLTAFIYFDKPVIATLKKPKIILESTKEPWGNISTMDATVIIDLIKKPIDKEKEKIRECQIIASVSAQSLCEFWAKFGIDKFYFEYDKGKKEYTTGLNQEIPKNYPEMLMRGLDTYRNKETGKFWKRDWLRDKAKVTTRGGAKI